MQLERAHKLVPQLRAERLRSCALYADAWTNDGRLTLANIRAAADRGATVLNYAEVVGARAAASRSRPTGATIAVRAKAVVNAAGPWVDRVRRLEDPTARAVDPAQQGRARRRRRRRGLGRGADDPARQGARQLRRPVGGHAAARHDRHASTTASRTTVARHGRRRARRCSREASVAVDGLGAPRASFCGLRVLPGGDGATANARRETVYSTGPDRDGQRRRRQADDVPPHRARRARASRRARALEAAAPAAGRDGPRPDRLAGRARHARRGTTCCTCTARSRPRCSPRPRRSVAARAARRRAAPTCARRSSTRATHEWARTDEDVFRRRTTAWLAGAAQPVRVRTTQP